jgi:hypothetical protein
MARRLECRNKHASNPGRVNIKQQALLPRISGRHQLYNWIVSDLDGGRLVNR